MSGSSPDIQPTAMEIANTQIALQQWQHYKNQAVPLENKYMGLVKRQNSPMQYGNAAGLAQGGVVEQYDPMLRKAAGEAFSNGVNPASGQFLAKAADMRAKGATAMGQAAAGAQQAQHDRYIGGLENILGIGRGQAGVAQAGLADAAQNQVEAAKARSQAQWDSDLQMGAAAGAAAGMAARPLVDKSVNDYTKSGSK